MLDMNLEELLNVKGDKYIEKLKNEAIYLNSDEEFVKYMPDDVEEKLFIIYCIILGFYIGVSLKIT